MKTKGFTLIELLAVIVILAIVALIATPIILNIIEDSRNESYKRSADNYAKAVTLAIARYELKYKETLSGNFKPQELESNKKNSRKLVKVGEESKILEVEYDGADVICEMINITLGKLYMTSCKIGDVSLDDYEYGKNPDGEDLSKYICLFKSGTSKTVGAQYSCTLGKTNIEDYNFYLLTNNSDNTTSLILESNYPNSDVSSFEPEVDYMLYSIDDNWGTSDIKVSLPTLLQVAGHTQDATAVALGSDSSFIKGYYWTSTKDEGWYSNEYMVVNDNVAIPYGYFPRTQYGVRPVITIPSDKLN